MSINDNYSGNSSRRVIASHVENKTDQKKAVYYETVLNFFTFTMDHIYQNIRKLCCHYQETQIVCFSLFTPTQCFKGCCLFYRRLTHSTFIQKPDTFFKETILTCIDRIGSTHNTLKVGINNRLSSLHVVITECSQS